MRRIRVVLAVASMAVLLVAFAAVPAMAKGNGDDSHNNSNNDNDHHALFRGNDANNDDFFGFNNRGDDVDFQDMNDTLLIGEDFFPGFFTADEGCPFWGDTEGIVNQGDCIH